MADKGISLEEIKNENVDLVRTFFDYSVSV